MGQESLPTVNVREEATCSLSFYEGRQSLAQKMTLEVQRMKSFVEFENLPLFLKTQHSMVARFPALQCTYTLYVHVIIFLKDLISYFYLCLYYGSCF